MVFHEPAFLAGRSRNQCVNPLLPRIACAAIPAAFRRRQEGRACLEGPNPKVRRDAMGNVPFPPLPAVIRRQAAIPRLGRSRRGLPFQPKLKGRNPAGTAGLEPATACLPDGCSASRAAPAYGVSGQARRRAPQFVAAAPPDTKRRPDTSHNPGCQRASAGAQKSPGGS